MLINTLVRNAMKQFQNFLSSYSVPGKWDEWWGSINGDFPLNKQKNLARRQLCLSARALPLSLLPMDSFPAICWNLSYETGHHIPWSVIHASCNLLKHWINIPKHLFKQSSLKLKSHGSLTISFHRVWLVRGMVELEMSPVHFGVYAAN